MDDPPPAYLADITVGGKYKFVSKRGSGSFGEIYKGIDVISSEEVAIKVESIKNNAGLLEHEAKIYKALAGGVGVAQLHYLGVEGNYNCMVIDMLGPTLNQLFLYCDRKFTLKTVLLLADQMISRLEFLHSKNFVHLDINPDNFLMGVRKKKHQVYLIDFGLSQEYVTGEAHHHIGTAVYASLNTHFGKDQFPIDDLESLGYVLMYFCRGGSLPWGNIRAAKKMDQYDRIMMKKMDTSPEDLCRGYPDEFVDYFKYLRKLNKRDTPDYAYLRKLFSDLFVRNGFEYDDGFDWMKRSLQNKNQGPSKSTLDSQNTNSDAANPAAANLD